MNSPDTVAIRAAAIQFSRVARAGGDPCMLAASSSILPEPLALPTSYPVVARLDPYHVLRTPQRDRTPRIHRTKGSHSKSALTSVTTNTFALQDVPNQVTLMSYRPSRQTRRGFVADPRDQLLQKNTELMQELSDMRNRQTLWMERAEHLFAMQ